MTSRIQSGIMRLGKLPGKQTVAIRYLEPQSTEVEVIIVVGRLVKLNNFDYLQCFH